MPIIVLIDLPGIGHSGPEEVCTTSWILWSFSTVETVTIQEQVGDIFSSFSFLS